MFQFIKILKNKKSETNRSNKIIDNSAPKTRSQAAREAKQTDIITSIITRKQSTKHEDSTKLVLSTYNMTESYENTKLSIQTNDQTAENWLNTFKEWNNKFKLSALEQILEICDHTHIKHVHNYIEPKLQRDYISEMPKELILLLQH